MVLKIIWLIILSILLVINTIFFVKDRKNYLNLLAAIFLNFAIIFSLHSIKKSQNISAKVGLEKEVLGINMKCPNCGNTIWPDDNFCSECGYKKDISDFGKNEEDFIIFECPNCKKLNLSKNKFCSECGKNLSEVNILEKR